MLSVDKAVIALERIIPKNGEIKLLEFGSVGANEMFITAEKENSFLTWVLRIVGVFLMWCGMAMVLKPIKVFADVLPFIGWFVGAGIGIVTFIIAVVLSLVLISLSWIFFRPLIGVPLFAMALGAAFGGFKFVKKQEQKHPYAPRGR